MKIRVLSLSEAQVADKWRNSTVSFRVCIPTADKETLLNPDLLPMYVGVRAWTFKKKSTNGPHARGGPFHGAHGPVGRASEASRGHQMPSAAGRIGTMEDESSSGHSSMRGMQCGDPPDMRDGGLFPPLPTRPEDSSGPTDSHLSGGPENVGESEPAELEAVSAAVPTTATSLSCKRKAVSPADNADRSRVRVIERTASTSSADAVIEFTSDNTGCTKDASLYSAESDLRPIDLRLSSKEHPVSWFQEANAVDNPK